MRRPVLSIGLLLGVLGGGWLDPLQVWAEGARELYILHCAGCHRPHGRGALPEVPGLWNDLGKIVQVPGGRDYLVRVPGSAQSPVSDEQLQTIVNWILQAFNADTLPDGFQPLSLDEVKAARANVLADPLKFRHALWQQVKLSASD